MQSDNFWNPQNRTFDEVYEIQAEAELREALKSIPEDVRLAALRGDAQSVQVALCNRWVDGVWKPELGPGARIEWSGGFVKARRLMALVLDSAKPAKDER